MNDLIAQAVELAKSHNWDEKHSRQVTKLALQLFDQLKPLHNLGSRERLLLEAGALLHDIGLGQSEKAHHKLSRDLIMEAEGLEIGRLPRTIIALVARYHRKSLPKNYHKYYGDLDKENKAVVGKLAGILRIADGLDRTHAAVVNRLQCVITENQLTISVEAKTESPGERDAAENKADLFKNIFRRKVYIKGL